MHCAAEERAARVEVGAVERTTASVREVGRRVSRELVQPGVAGVEFGSIPMRLLEVVPDDLVALDETVAR